VSQKAPKYIVREYSITFIVQRHKFYYKQFTKQNEFWTSVSIQSAYSEVTG